MAKIDDAQWIQLVKNEYKGKEKRHTSQIQALPTQLFKH